MRRPGIVAWVRASERHVWALVAVYYAVLFAVLGLTLGPRIAGAF